MRLNQKRATLLAVIIGVSCMAILASAVTASAQEARSFEVGQAVEIYCDCLGRPAWTKGTIESIEETHYVIRYGNGRFQTKPIPFGSDQMRNPNQAVAVKRPVETEPQVKPTTSNIKPAASNTASAAVSNERIQNFNQQFVMDIDAAMGAYGDRIKEEVQIMVFERERWVASLAKDYPQVFQEAGVAPSADLFAEVFAKADELKTQIERDAPTRSWDSPVLHNAPLEAFVRNYYAKYRKGVQILKIGMTMTNFKTFKNSLGIPTSQVISGSALVKIQNRPFCQNQVFELKKEYLGGGRFSAVQPSYIGVEGTFVKCQ